MPRTARGQGLRVPAAGSAVRLIPGSPGPASRRFSDQPAGASRNKF
ncbi:hypothetical protein [uncultured Bilophila sp.]|nr:hypothetical protein [uncultured Bilophila sp.]